MTESGKASEDSGKVVPEADKVDLGKKDDSVSPPEFGSPFDYDATAEASLSEPPATSDATPSPGSTGTGPGWDTYSGVGTGPGWGSTPIYPPPSGSDPTTVFPNAGSYPPPSGEPYSGYPQPGEGPVYGAPDPNYGAPSGSTQQAPGFEQGYGQQSYQYPPGPSAYQQPGYGAGGYGAQGHDAQSYGAQPYGAAGYGAYAAYSDPSAPFGRDPRTGEPYSDKSKVTAGLLQILVGFLGICGVGRLYIGSTGIGLAQLLLVLLGYVLLFVAIGFLVVPVVWLWAFIDGIMMLAGSVRDGQGRLLRS